MTATFAVTYETALPGAWAQGFASIGDAKDYAATRSQHTGGHVIEVRIWSWTTEHNRRRGRRTVHSRYAAGLELHYNGFRD